jgi:putative flippase GtrA
MQNKLKELVLFGISGVLGFAADACTTLLLHGFVGVYLARIPAFFAAVTTTWIFNRNITFSQSASRHHKLLHEYLHYVSLSLFGLAVNYSVYAIAITLLKHQKFAILICVGLGSLAGMGVNYVTSKRHLYNKEKAEFSED